MDFFLDGNGEKLKTLFQRLLSFTIFLTVWWVLFSVYLYMDCRSGLNDAHGNMFLLKHIFNDVVTFSTFLKAMNRLNNFYCKNNTDKRRSCVGQPCHLRPLSRSFFKSQSNVAPGVTWSLFSFPFSNNRFPPKDSDWSFAVTLVTF